MRIRSIKFVLCIVVVFKFILFKYFGEVKLRSLCNIFFRIMGYRIGVEVGGRRYLGSITVGFVGLEVILYLCVFVFWGEGVVA